MDNGILRASHEAMPSSRYMICCTRYACDYVLGILCSQVAPQACSLVALMIREYMVSGSPTTILRVLVCTLVPLRPHEQGAGMHPLVSLRSHAEVNSMLPDSPTTMRRAMTCSLIAL